MIEIKSCPEKFFCNNNIEKKPSDFTKWVKEGVYLITTKRIDDTTTGEIKKLILKKMELVNKKELDNNQRAYLTHIELILKTNSLKQYLPEIYLDMLIEH